MSEGEGDSDFRDDRPWTPALSGHPSCHLVSPKHIQERQTPITPWSTALVPREPKDTQTLLWVQPEFQTGLCPRGSWSSVWLPRSFLASSQSAEAAVRRSPAEGPGAGTGPANSVSSVPGAELVCTCALWSPSCGPAPPRGVLGKENKALGCRSSGISAGGSCH